MEILSDTVKSSLRPTDDASNAAILGVKTVCVIEDDATTSHLLISTLQQAGYKVELAKSGKAAREFFEKDIAVYLMDIGLPDCSGLTLLKEMQQKNPASTCVVLSGSEDLVHVLTALNDGAFWYLTKPVDTKELLVIVERALQQSIFQSQSRSLKQTSPFSTSIQNLTGRSKLEKELGDVISAIAAGDSSCLITGDRGTGKGMVGRAIHEQSKRTGKPFYMVSCSSIPREALFEELSRMPLANQGTFLIDDVEHLPAEAQSQILQMLRDEKLRHASGGHSSVDVRIIATSSIDLEKEVKRNRFSEELYNILNENRINLPSLSSRLDELPFFIDQVMGRIAQRKGADVCAITPEAMILLLKHPWPGNFRELERVLELAVFLCAGNRIQPQDLKFSEVNRITSPYGNRITGDMVLPLRQVEKNTIEHALAACDGNKAKAARLLQISEKSIYNKMKRLKIQDYVRS